MVSGIRNTIRRPTKSRSDQAWSVNFNLPLESFLGAISGMRSLVDFALSSKRSQLPRFIFISSLGIFRSECPAIMCASQSSEIQTIHSRENVYQRTSSMMVDLCPSKDTPSPNGYPNKCLLRQLLKQHCGLPFFAWTKLLEASMALGIRVNGFLCFFGQA